MAQLEGLLQYVEERRDQALREPGDPCSRTLLEFCNALQVRILDEMHSIRTVSATMNKTAAIQEVVSGLLKAKGKPMRAADIRSEVEASYPQLVEGMTYENFVNYLSRMKSLHKVGRGTWGLKSWGGSGPSK